MVGGIKFTFVSNYVSHLSLIDLCAFLLCFRYALSMFVCDILDCFYSLHLTSMPTLKEGFLYGLVSRFCLDKKLPVFVMMHK